MMDLVILLSISLAVTAGLGLLLAGFVWVPWLIGLLLMVLLLVLMKVPSPEESRVLAEFTQDEEPLLEQASDTSDNVTAETDTVLNYRGVKYQLKATSSSAEPTAEISEGKYRGQPWKRSV